MYLLVLLFLFLQLAINPIAAFVGGPQQRHKSTTVVPFVLVPVRQSSLVTLAADKDDDGDDNENSQINADLQDFLDRSFFDPDQVDENAQGPVGWFANLVKNDYVLAETLYVGVFGVVLLLISQELLRLQIYGIDGYVPFTRGISSASGNLF
jgi:hypothetical protein